MLRFFLLMVCVSATIAKLKCKDYYDCTQWSRSYCTDKKYGDWMKMFCGDYCGVCKTTGGGSSGGSGGSGSFKCKDYYNCTQWSKSYCTDKKYGDWMKMFCGDYCGVCKTTGGGGSGGSGSSGQCGQVKVAKSRVIGGIDAKPGAWPWQIAMYYRNRFHCGGSLVNKQWIVTAAHCVKNRIKNSFKVYLGDHDRSTPNGEQVFNVSTIIIHPEYNKKRQINNDIALMKLEGPAMLTYTVQPVCLPAQDESQTVDTKCYITGWGKTKHPGGSVNVLQQLAMTVQSNAVCHKKNSKYFPITKSMICGANPNVVPNQSGCHGDSGGPFVCQQSDGSWKLQGAVSWGSPRCNIKDAFTVFARVAHFRNWIDSYIKN